MGTGEEEEEQVKLDVPNGIFWEEDGSFLLESFSSRDAWAVECMVAELSSSVGGVVLFGAGMVIFVA